MLLLVQVFPRQGERHSKLTPLRLIFWGSRPLSTRKHQNSACKSASTAPRFIEAAQKLSRFALCQVQSQMLALPWGAFQSPWGCSCRVKKLSTWNMPRGTRRVPSGVIKHGWKIPELKGDLNRKITDQWPIFQPVMFDNRRVITKSVEDVQYKKVNIEMHSKGRKKAPINFVACLRMFLRRPIFWAQWSIVALCLSFSLLPSCFFNLSCVFNPIFCQLSGCHFLGFQSYHLKLT